MPAASFAQEASTGKRLIQTSPSVRQWMTEAEIAEVSQKIHGDGRCGGFMDVTDFPDKAYAPIGAAFALGVPAPSQARIVEPILAELSPKRLTDNITALSAFPNRYYQSESGEKAAQWIHGEFTRLAAGRSDITVEYFRHDFRQPSVIARIAGTGGETKDPKLAAETVIVGAHEDSVNWYSGGAAARARAPGADDDASGVATVLEAYRVIVQSGFRPARTLEFITYAGEERGLLGSQAIAGSYQRAGRSVKGVLQMDMTMFPGAKREMVFISDHVSPELTRFTKSLLDQYVKMPWRDEPCGYACSDHASWSEVGFPSAFPFESPTGEMNPDIHTDRDLLAALNPEFGLHFARLSVAFLVEMAQAAP